MQRSDPFLPISPARVKALVLPVGPVHRDRFASFLERLNGESTVHLRDISADGRPNRNMFNPLAFPYGVVFYDLITHVPQPSHLALAPFDQYREPLVVLALADGAAIKSASFGSRRQSAAGRSIEERNVRTLYQELEELRDTYTRALVHRVLIFDYEPSPDSPIPIPEGMDTVPPPAQSKRTTMRTVMCDVSSLLLAEMNTLARSFEAMSYIESPGQIGSASGGGRSFSEDGTGSAPPSRRNSQFAPPSHVSGGGGSGSGGMTRSSSISSNGSGSHSDRAQARMSMPALFRDSSSSATMPGQPSMPGRSGLSGPATTFDEIAMGAAAASHSGMASPERNGSPSRGDATDISLRFQGTPLSSGQDHRASVQDHRVSVQGFGPGGLNERWRNKGKNRVTIVVASLYLQAGRWTDALKELVDGATVSRSINDHIWHGKALELIVVCLLLLAWADLEFQVPTICLPPPEKGAAAAAAVHALEAAERANPNQPRWLRNLQQILPELLDRILGLYGRISAERLPPLPLAETTIRFCNILTALHVAEGVLGRTFLDIVVEGRSDAVKSTLTTSPRLGVVPGRQQILAAVLRAFPAATSSELMLPTVDRIVILSGIASVLGRLGYRRKRALVARELLSVLTDGLVEARTRGAAELGIHPAAGLVTPGSGGHGGSGGGGSGGSGGGGGGVALDLAEGDAETGMEAFLGLLLRAYGVVELQPGRQLAKQEVSDTDEAVVSRIGMQAAARQFGLPSLKIDILRACINFSEALPDFGGVAKFSSDLLRTAGSGIAPGPRREDAAPMITRDEQVRLATNIAKATGLARRLGLADVTAEYWDEFLVRGVRLELPPAPCVPVAHSGSELALKGGKAAAASTATATVRTSQDVDPFIHNPFLKAVDKAVVEQTLVAMEPATFRLTLQNPFDMEVVIDSIRLETTGVAFESFAESVVVGPYRTQIVRVGGIPQASGSLQVTGAIVQVHGCRERRFPIMTQPWVAERPEKIKAIGVAPFEGSGDSNMNGNMSSTANSPAAETLSLQVIPAQPLVVVQSTTLPQSSAMILEGERQAFSVTLQNLSTTTAVDFLIFSFRDSTQASVQAALASRDASPAELYEYELMLAKRPALRLRGRQGREGKSRYIGPGETATFDFEILGKPGLTDGTIQVDYGHLGVTADGVAADVVAGGQFHTRQVSLHLTVTVNASVEVVRMDVLPLHGRIPEPLWERCVEGGEGRAADALSKNKGDSDDADSFCLLLLDLRNAWPSNMRVRLWTGGNGADGTDADAVVTEHILPGNTTRVLLPLRRIYLEDPHASIPALNPARQRQFVVSTSKISPDMERASREAFWYRERILDVLRGEWTAEGGGGRGGVETTTKTKTMTNTEEAQIPATRHGLIELRSMRLTTRMIEAVKIDEVGIEITIEDPGAAAATTRGKTSKKTEKTKKSTAAEATRGVRVDEFVQLRVRITNRTAQPIYPLLRLMPALCHRPHNVALDFTRKFAWNGTLQQGLPLLGPRTSTDVCIGATALCRGEFEVTASVEETRLWVAAAAATTTMTHGDENEEDGEAKAAAAGRPRSNTETQLMDTMLGAKERRIWHSRAPCHFVVTD